MAAPKDKRKPEPSRHPKLAEIRDRATTTDAWWYENEGSIDVLMRGGPGTLCARIPWSALIKALRRCKPGVVR